MGFGLPVGVGVVGAADAADAAAGIWRSFGIDVVDIRLPSGMIYAGNGGIYSISTMCIIKVPFHTCIQEQNRGSDSWLSFVKSLFRFGII